MTARHIDFLFNREETVVPYWNASLEALGIDCRPETLRAEMDRAVEIARGIFGEGDWQLPPSDESKVGQD